MNDVPFHLTVMGRRFYEAQLPKLIAAIERLNENLERIGPVVVGAGSTGQAPSATPPSSGPAK